MSTNPDNNKTQLVQMATAVGVILGVPLALFAVANGIIKQPLISLVVAIIAAVLISIWVVRSGRANITQIITAWLALAVVVLAGFVIWLVWARTMTLEGRISYAAGNPMRYEKVILYDASNRVYETETDADGYYQFTQVPIGKYRLRVCDSEVEGEAKGLVRKMRQNLIIPVLPRATPTPTPTRPTATLTLTPMPTPFTPTAIPVPSTDTSMPEPPAEAPVTEPGVTPIPEPSDTPKPSPTLTFTIAPTPTPTSLPTVTVTPSPASTPTPNYALLPTPGYAYEDRGARLQLYDVRVDPPRMQLRFRLRNNTGGTINFKWDYSTDIEVTDNLWRTSYRYTGKPMWTNKPTSIPLPYTPELPSQISLGDGHSIEFYQWWRGPWIDDEVKCVIVTLSMSRFEDVQWRIPIAR